MAGHCRSAVVREVVSACSCLSFLHCQGAFLSLSLSLSVVSLFAKHAIHDQGQINDESPAAHSVDASSDVFLASLSLPPVPASAPSSSASRLLQSQSPPPRRFFASSSSSSSSSLSTGSLSFDASSDSQPPSAPPVVAAVGSEPPPEPLSFGGIGASCSSTSSVNNLSLQVCLCCLSVCIIVL